MLRKLFLLVATVSGVACAEEGRARAAVHWHVTTLAGSGPSTPKHVTACRRSGLPPAKANEAIDGPALTHARFAAPTRVQIVNGTAFVMDGMHSLAQLSFCLDTLVPRIHPPTPGPRAPPWTTPGVHKLATTVSVSAGCP